MDSNDVKKLWALLLELYPRQKQPTTDKRLAAWTMALEPYSYEEAKAATLAHVRKSDYYPSVSEIVANLPKPANASWMDKYDDRKPSSGELWQKYIEERGLDDGAGD